jgi:hypothetical protein
VRLVRQPKVFFSILDPTRHKIWDNFIKKRIVIHRFAPTILFSIFPTLCQRASSKGNRGRRNGAYAPRPSDLVFRPLGPAPSCFGLKIPEAAGEAMPPRKSLTGPASSGRLVCTPGPMSFP